MNILYAIAIILLFNFTTQTNFYYNQFSNSKSAITKKINAVIYIYLVIFRLLFPEAIFYLINDFETPLSEKFLLH